MKKVPKAEEDRLLTVEEAMEMLSVSRSMLYKMGRQGALPHVMLGKARRYRLSALRKLIEAGEVGHG